MCMSVCPKNSSQMVNGNDLKFAHSLCFVIFYVILRSTTILNFQVF